jgi:sec-independent protein translocase protein TatC
MAGRGEMGFFDHLGELRFRLIRILAFLAAASAVSLAFAGRLLRLLLAPYGSPLLVIGPTEGVSVYLRVALTAGASVTLPYALWEIWGFVRPGLHASERRYVRVILPGSLALFLAGASFAWFLLIPAAVRFLASFAPESFRVEWTSERYVPFVTSLLFWIGVCFQMPLAAYYLARLRIVSARLLLKAWRYAMVAVAVAAALVTPTVDPFNMMLVAVPLAGLYFASVLVAALARRKPRP